MGISNFSGRSILHFVFLVCVPLWSMHFWWYKSQEILSFCPTRLKRWRDQFPLLNHSCVPAHPIHQLNLSKGPTDAGWPRKVSSHRGLQWHTRLPHQRRRTPGWVGAWPLREPGKCGMRHRVWVWTWLILCPWMVDLFQGQAARQWSERKVLCEKWGVLSHLMVPCSGTSSPGRLVLWDSEK